MHTIKYGTVALDIVLDMEVQFLKVHLSQDYLAGRGGYLKLTEKVAQQSDTMNGWPS